MVKDWRINIMAKERKCLFCQNSYVYCGHCREYQKYPEWMALFDTEKCYDLYNAVGGYYAGINTIEDVKKALDKHNVTDYSIFSKGLQDKIKALDSPKKEEPKVEPKVDKEETVKKNNGGFNNMKKTNKKYDYGRRVNNEE
jgi:L-rhamnose mutarotase